MIFFDEDDRRQLKLFSSKPQVVPPGCGQKQTGSAAESN